MPLIGRNTVFASILVLALLLCATPFRAADTLPAQLTDEEFWNLVSNLSEPGGDFGSDNFVSNERSFQHVLADLAEVRQPASAYIGVGPEQNFTYIQALKPRIAFIVDIRRQNMIEHLMYKALFELSADRSAFLSNLFSRARPDNAGSNSTIEALIDAFGRTPADPQLLQDNIRTVKNRLIRVHGFKLNTEDEAALDKLLQAFSVGGPNLTYNGPVVRPGGVMPTFGEIMTETDEKGIHRSFLATEENFLAVQELEKKNLLIPVVGDFAGPHALRSVGEYLKNHNATVTSFYTSNVEQYLFMYGVWEGFYANVATLPVNAKSVFIRGLIRSANGDYSPSPALPASSHYETAVFPIVDLVTAYNNGTVQRYNDILRTAR
jgi:hypothetical protein